MRRRTRQLALLGLLVISVVGLSYLAGPLSVVLLDSLDWIQGSGTAGLLVFVALYAVATWLMLPASWPQMAAGFLLGPLLGFASAMALSTSFGLISFLLARTCLRGLVIRRLSRGGWLAALDEAVVGGGLSMVILLRISPLAPYNTVSYALGATGVSTRTYLLGSMIGGVLPMSLYATMGASASDLAAVLAGEAQAPGWIQWIGLAITVTATLAVTARVRSVLRARGLH